MTNIVPGNLETTLHPAVQTFAEGVGGVQPATDVVEIAHRIAMAAIDKTIEPEISVDVDGALSFDLRLANGPADDGRVGSSGWTGCEHLR